MATFNAPELVGLSQSDAEAKLRDVGLTRGTVKKVSSDTAPTGTVSATNPKSGTSVNSGSAVDLEVSTGPAPVAVPDVIGLTQPSAEGALRGVGLTLGTVRTQHSNYISANGVSGTDPETGALVNVGSKVNLVLSNGPEPNWLAYIPTILFAVLAFIVLGVIGFIITSNGQTFLKLLSNKDIARGLITFLIAISTVGIAIILAISTLVLTEGPEGDKRFDRGKQVLAVLIGVLGTIVGYYFGSVDTNGGLNKATTEQAQITTRSLPNGAANQPYVSTALLTTGLTPPLTWSVSPELPSDLKLDPKTGAISGTPKAPSKTNFTFTVTDSSKPAVSLTVNLDLEIK